VLRAIVAESLRLSASTTKADAWYQLTVALWYKRWFLPKGSIFIVDRKRFSTDSRKWPGMQVILRRSNSQQFLPEQAVSKSIEDIDAVVFGYRASVKHLVEMILSSTIVKVLGNFDIVIPESGDTSYEFIVRHAHGPK
jgi:hypothetical protein